MPLSLIKAFQKTLTLETVDPLKKGATFGEGFALRRFLKKFECPDSHAAQLRKLKTFQNWVEYDESLTSVFMPHGAWYRARLEIHKILRDFQFGELTFTGGSQSEPLHGLQSIADKLLTHSWEISPNCVDLFVTLSHRDHAFLRAAKIRMRNSMSRTRYRKTIERIFKIRHNRYDVMKYIILWNLKSREASRFSTVAKNNEIDRSIDLQPFCNMLVQRAIGLGIRQVIKNHFDVDLENAQQVHGKLIMNPENATVDLKNASDSNSWSLVEFLCPKWFVVHLRAATPWFTEGLDGHYYVTKKISSMGNGFTFELMTLFLLTLARQFDEKSSVYGDDIVIKTSVCEDFLAALASGGYQVNVDKTFLTGPFRESCGYNYHSVEGYIRSFDFRWPNTIGDCITFFNKLVLLSEYESFKGLRDRLARLIPTALRGPIPPGVRVGPAFQADVDYGSYFWFNKPGTGVDVAISVVSHVTSNLNWTEWRGHYGYEFRPKVRKYKRSDISMKRHALLYFQYISAGRQSDIVLTGRGEWARVLFISNGRRSIRVKSLMKEDNDSLKTLST